MDFRRVIQIRAEDSPNVKLGILQESNGQTPTDELIVPGVISYSTYKQRRKEWDKIRQCVGLDAQFYEGAELKLYPEDWIVRAERLWVQHRSQNVIRKAMAGGCDPAEGGDRTTFAAVDRLGLIELLSLSTPDTSVITAQALAFMRKWSLPPERFVFDRGGGGKQHADRLRTMGYKVRTVAFGESLIPDPRRGLVQIEQRKEHREKGYEFKTRRTEMFWELSEVMDPNNPQWPQGFSLPLATEGPQYAELRRQMAVIPRLYDEEGRAFLPPKNRKPGQEEGGGKKLKTLVEMIGHSPDELDSVVMALHGLLHEVKVPVAGAI